ncbi:MAG: thymidine phosphorylase [Methylobacteriaceae bacterium]|nr:thymidine phosphorylase [Methylobacteriaceae bacterium]
MAELFAPEIIRRKRDGLPLERSEIEFLIEGLVSGAVGAEQAAAFAMAVFFRGMDARECAELTSAMTASGTRLDWRALDLGGPVLDKHSTGGVGDVVSLMLAPMVAACGGYVPMIAGRGLGHTGGTVDKLESIPGYRTAPDLATMQRVVRDAGCAIVGQSDDLAPADRRLYAIRDVTATVESIPLITASILSKKLAAGLDALVMDVKTGNGAFMVAREQSRALAQSLVSTGKAAGLPTRAMITDMNEPLASCAGNAIEVAYAIDYLKGERRDARLHEVVLALGAEMLRLGKLATSRDDARARLEQALASGAAAERFAKMVAGLGGPADLLDAPARHLATAPVVIDMRAKQPGFVTAIDVRALGLAVVALGGGRRRAGEKIDPSVGLSDLAPVGADVGERPLARIHARDDASAAAAVESVRQAYAIGDGAPAAEPVIVEQIA